MNKTLSRTLIILGVLGAAAFPPASFAISLLPGDDEAATAEANVAGATLEDTLVSNFTSEPGENQFSGTLTTQIYSSDSNNGYSGVGGLTFTFSLSNDSTSETSIGRITLEGWAGYYVNAGYIDGTEITPLSMDRDPSGDVVGFSFSSLLGGDGQIDPGEMSELLVIRTDADAFVGATANVIDGSIVVTATFGPTSIAVPDSGTASVLWGASLLALAGYRRLIGKL